MSRRRKNKKDLPVFERVQIYDAGAEGKAIARVDNMVIFVPFGAPGDIVDIKVIGKRKSFYEGEIIGFHHYSDVRRSPKCEHFGLCGGCKWQHIEYGKQLYFKQKQVVDSFERIGKIKIPAFQSIIPSESEYFYRNKLEFSFSNRKWLTDISSENINDTTTNGLGMHLPRMFDRIVDLENCYLQKEPSNSIRLFLRDYGIKRNLTFYDSRNHHGFLRNVTIRTASTGQTMVIISFGYDDNNEIAELVNQLSTAFPQITSLFTVINQKRNDTIYDLALNPAHGKPYITEMLENLEFKVGPLSFFQTNTEQALVLYKIVRQFGSFQGNELVYDLYCGTGTITCFVAKGVKSIVGIDNVPEAIDDARENSNLNGIFNTAFVVGDLATTLNSDFVIKYGAPDVIITDPPRSGMHPKVIKQILEILPEKIIYVSCNPATQARDISLLAERYLLAEIQPVDMFPQTHHVENVSLLIKKSLISEQLV